jgi:hypothetical protein
LSRPTYRFDGGRRNHRLRAIQRLLGFVNVPGVVFRNFNADTASDSFPAHSGTHIAVQSCCDAPSILTFDQPISKFSGYFNYYSQNSLFGLAMIAFGASDQYIKTVYSPYVNNLDKCNCGFPGSFYDPNELLTVSSVTPIYSLMFLNDDGEITGTFSMDDISFNPTPEPASLALTAAAFLTVGLGYLLITESRQRQTRAE